MKSLVFHSMFTSISLVLLVVQQECPAMCTLVGRGVVSWVHTLVLENVEMAMDYNFVKMMGIMARR